MLLEKPIMLQCGPSMWSASPTELWPVCYNIIIEVIVMSSLMEYAIYLGRKIFQSITTQLIDYN